MVEFNVMKLYIRLLGFVKPYLWVIILAAVFMLLNSIATNCASVSALIPFIDKVIGGNDIVLPTKVPVFLQNLIDKINHLPKLTLFNTLVIYFIIAFFLKNVFTFFQQYLMTDVSSSVLRDLRNGVYDKLLEFSLDFYSKAHTGSLVSRITYDTSIIQNAITEGLTDLFYQTFQLLVSLFMVISTWLIFKLDWALLFLSFIVIPVIMYAVVAIGKKLKKISAETQEQMGKVTTTLVETISGMQIVVAFGMEDYERRKFAGHNQRLYKLFMKSAKRDLSLGPVTEFIGIFCVAAVIWLGGSKAIAEGSSVGAFFVFIGSILLMLKPLNRLSRIYSVNQKMLAAAERTFEILDAKSTVQEMVGAFELPTFKNRITFKDVSFAYGSETVLKDINLEAKKGEVVAIVGPSGVGKSSLVNLIPRFYAPTEGEVLIDGQNIKDVTLKSLRDQIGIVTQETILFHDTVRANIAYGKENASDEEVIQAAKIANAHDFIIRLPSGYDTIVGERGHRLSGGERQRLAIARAVLKNAPILILDEATSQLDMESEALVQEAIDELMKGRTVFVIAHRLSTIKFATKIIVLENCRIVESGTHEELLRRGGSYKRLYEMQFKEEGIKNA